MPSLCINYFNILFDSAGLIEFPKETDPQQRPGRPENHKRSCLRNTELIHGCSQLEYLDLCKYKMRRAHERDNVVATCHDARTLACGGE